MPRPGDSPWADTLRKAKEALGGNYSGAGKTLQQMQADLTKINSVRQPSKTKFQAVAQNVGNQLRNAPNRSFSKSIVTNENFAQKLKDEAWRRRKREEEYEKLLEDYEPEETKNAADYEAEGVTRPTANMTAGPEFDRLGDSEAYSVNEDAGQFGRQYYSPLEDFDYDYEFMKKKHREHKSDDPRNAVTKENAGKFLVVPDHEDRVLPGWNHDSNGNWVMSQTQSAMYNPDGSDYENSWFDQLDKRAARENAVSTMINDLDPNDPNYAKKVTEAMNNLDDGNFTLFSGKPVNPTALGDAFNLLQEDEMRLGGFMRDVPRILRDSWNSTKDMKLKTSEGREIDESDLMDAIAASEKNAENRENGETRIAIMNQGQEAIGYMTPEQFKQFTGRDYDDKSGDDAQEAAQLYVDHNTVATPDGMLQVLDDRGNVTTTVDPADLTVQSFWIPADYDALTLADGSTVSREEMQDIQNHLQEGENRYVGSNSNPIAGVPLLGDFIDYMMGDPAENGTLSLEGFGPNLLNAAASTAPYMLPYGIGESIAGSQLYAAAQGLNPFSYDWITGTYANPGVQTNGEYMANLLDTASQTVGEYLMGLAGTIGKGASRGLSSFLESAGLKSAENAAAKAIQKEVKGLNESMLLREGKSIAGEGGEEVLQDTASEAAHAWFDPNYGGMWANDKTDEYGRSYYDDNGNVMRDADTLFTDRVSNAAQNLAESFVLGGLLGGVMGAPGNAAQKKRDADRLAIGDVLPEHMKSADFKAPTTKLESDRINDLYEKYLADKQEARGE